MTIPPIVIERRKLGLKITVEFLANFIPAEKDSRPVIPPYIIAEIESVAASTGIAIHWIMSSSHKRNYAEARWKAWWNLHEYHLLSDQSIARYFNVDRTTVSKGIQQWNKIKKK